jgi:membrane fusion protein
LALFRQQAIAAQQTQSMGGIILIRPISFTFLTLFAVTMVGIVCAFLAWGSYTKRSTVTGQLVPDTGLLKSYVPQTGIVLEKHVAEGQAVKVGDILYVLSSERQSSKLGDTQAAISIQVEQRQASLRDELDKTHALQQEERSGLIKKIASLQNELAQLHSQIEGQRDRVKLAETTVARPMACWSMTTSPKNNYSKSRKNYWIRKPACKAWSAITSALAVNSRRSKLNWPAFH